MTDLASFKPGDRVWVRDGSSEYYRMVGLVVNGSSKSGKRTPELEIGATASSKSQYYHYYEFLVSFQGGASASFKENQLDRATKLDGTGEASE